MATVYVYYPDLDLTVAAGDTYPVREELKRDGYKWDPERRVWVKRGRDPHRETLSLSAFDELLSRLDREPAETLAGEVLRLAEDALRVQKLIPSPFTREADAVSFLVKRVRDGAYDSVTLPRVLRTILVKAKSMVYIEPDVMLTVESGSVVRVKARDRSVQALIREGVSRLKGRARVIPVSTSLSGARLVVRGMSAEDAARELARAVASKGYIVYVVRRAPETSYYGRAEIVEGEREREGVPA